MKETYRRKLLLTLFSLTSMASAPGWTWADGDLARQLDSSPAYASLSLFRQPASKSGARSSTPAPEGEPGTTSDNKEAEPPPLADFVPISELVREPGVWDVAKPRDFLSVDEKEVEPSILRRAIDGADLQPAPGEEGPITQALLRLPFFPTLGFAGPSGVLPSEQQMTSDFVPIEDRWRIGFPLWDRYGKGQPYLNDYPYEIGHWWDPYNQNVVKGDYSVIGQNTFMNFSVASISLFEGREVPTATTPFESTAHANQEEFFGNPNQFFYPQFIRLQLDVFHGDTSFKPVDWMVRVAPVFNLNTLDVEELAVVNPNVLNGTTRIRNWNILQEWFLETKLTDTSPYYDFISARAGSQFFNADFRGLLFFDTNLGIRLFGTRNANRDQFNVILFDQVEKDTNSELNTFETDRNQNTLIANYYHQDFLVPGYTAQFSGTFNHDSGNFKFDNNNFLVRPDPTGVFQQHEVNTFYLGWTGDGHFGRYNVNNAFYWALGRDTLNPLSGQDLFINAQMAALEVSYDRDYIRFRSSVFWSSGDHNINDDVGRGFDTIFDNPNFVGGQFSYWQRQAVRLLGVNLVNRFSLVPDLRSSKIQGQPNFVNPGIFIINAGFDVELTPQWRIINNYNCLWFDTTKVIEQYVFQNNIDDHIGFDLSLGTEYRPFLNNNVIITGGISTLLPGAGFRQLYASLDGDVDPLVAAFMQMTLLY